jgi:hypothetical protein
MPDAVAEQATGYVATMEDGGPFYIGDGRGGGVRLADHEAAKHIRTGEPVEVPNAGAGDYREIAQRLDLGKVEVVDWTSSAGDWTFRLEDGSGLFQENRYPGHGFKYSIGVLADG